MARGSGSDAEANTKKNDKNGNEASSRSGGASRHNIVPIDQVVATNHALRDLLASLGATRPLYVIDKQLKTSDVNRNQARLLFSCKSGPRALCPLAACFTDQEARRVRDKGAGLLVTALDRRGRSYDLTCKYLDSNHAYRFISGWKTFLEAHGLLLDDDQGGLQRDVHVELWAFRSWALPNRFVDDEEDEKKKNKKKKKKVREETGHPDGALGLVLLHYEYAVEHGGGGYDREDEAGMVVEEAPPVTRQEDLLAGAAWATSMTKDEIVTKFGEKMAHAAIGMSMLIKDARLG